MTLSPSQLLGFSIAETTAAEREALRQAGYGMPDWDPGRPPTDLRSLEPADDDSAA